MRIFCDTIYCVRFQYLYLNIVFMSDGTPTAVERENRAVTLYETSDRASEMSPDLEQSIEKVRQDLARAFWQEKTLSVDEYRSYLKHLHRLDSALQSVSLSPAQKAKRVQTLHELLTENLSTNTQRKERENQMLQLIDQSGVFTTQEKEAWIKGARDVTERYNTRSVRTKQEWTQLKNESMTQLDELLAFLPDFVRSGVEQLARFQALESTTQTAAMGNFSVLKRTDIVSSTVFLSQVYPLRKGYMKELETKLGEEFQAFQKKYTAFLPLPELEKRWQEKGELHEKFQLLATWYAQAADQQQQETDKQALLREKKAAMGIALKESHPSKVLEMLQTLEPGESVDLSLSLDFEALRKEASARLKERGVLMVRAEQSAQQNNLEMSRTLYEQAGQIEADAGIGLIIQGIDAKKTALQHFETYLGHVEKGDSHSAHIFKQKAHEHPEIARDPVLLERERQALDRARHAEAVHTLTGFSKSQIWQTLGKEEELLAAVEKDMKEHREDIRSHTDTSVKARLLEKAADASAADKTATERRIEQKTSHLNDAEKQESDTVALTIGDEHNQLEHITKTVKDFHEHTDRANRKTKHVRFKQKDISDDLTVAEAQQVLGQKKVLAFTRQKQTLEQQTGTDLSDVHVQKLEQAA